MTKQKENWEEEIKDLTILIATAREEGDEEEHKRVVNRIMEIIFQAKQQEREELLDSLKMEGKIKTFNGLQHLKTIEYAHYSGIIDGYNQCVAEINSKIIKLKEGLNR